MSTYYIIIQITNKLIKILRSFFLHVGLQVYSHSPLQQCPVVERKLCFQFCKFCPMNQSFLLSSKVSNSYARTQELESQSLWITINDLAKFISNTKAPLKNRYLRVQHTRTIPFINKRPTGVDQTTGKLLDKSCSCFQKLLQTRVVNRATREFICSVTCIRSTTQAALATHSRFIRGINLESVNLRDISRFLSLRGSQCLFRNNLSNEV